MVHYLQTTAYVLVMGWKACIARRLFSVKVSRVNHGFLTAFFEGWLSESGFQVYLVARFYGRELRFQFSSC